MKLNRLYRIRIRQTLIYGWMYSKFIAEQSGLNRIRVYFDIINCFRKYYVFSIQYRDNNLWKLNDVDLKQRAKTIGHNNLRRDNWVTEKYKNHRFITKWSQHKWEDSPKLRDKRRQAYMNFFKTGKDLHVQYNVEIRREHFLEGTISIGNNVLLSKNVFIDYSGELVMKNGVKLSDGVVIETHRHEFVPGSKSQKAIPTKILIEEGVWVGQKGVICEDCIRIGRFSQIGAGAVVRNPIPPYALVVGNPAKIVGFLYTPEEVAEFEKDKYPETERTDIEKYKKLYEKYFINRMSEIKKSLSN